MLSEFPTTIFQLFTLYPLINEFLITPKTTEHAEFGLLGEQGVLGKEMTAVGISY